MDSTASDSSSSDIGNSLGGASGQGGLTPAEREFSTMAGKLRIMIADPLRGYSLANGRYEPFGQLAQRYIIPLLCIAIALRCFFALFIESTTFFGELWNGIIRVVLFLISAFLVGQAASMLAPKFEGSTTSDRGSVWFGLGCSAAYLGDILGSVPYVGVVLQLIGLYSLYLLSVGSHAFLGIPRHRSLGFLVVIIVLLGMAYLALSYAVAKIFLGV